jgi:hypothetical protein
VAGAASPGTVGTTSGSAARAVRGGEGRGSGRGFRESPVAGPDRRLAARGSAARWRGRGWEPFARRRGACGRIKTLETIRRSMRLPGWRGPDLPQPAARDGRVRDDEGAAVATAGNFDGRVLTTPPTSSLLGSAGAPEEAGAWLNPSNLLDKESKALSVSPACRANMVFECDIVPHQSESSLKGGKHGEASCNCVSDGGCPSDGPGFRPEASQCS